MAQDESHGVENQDDRINLIRASGSVTIPLP